MNSFQHNLFARIIALYLLQSNDILSPSLTADLQALGYKSWPRYSALREALVLPRWMPAPPQECSRAAHRPVNGGGRKSIGTRRVRLVTTTTVSFFSLAMCGRYCPKNQPSMPKNVEICGRPSKDPDRRVRVEDGSVAPVPQTGIWIFATARDGDPSAAPVTPVKTNAGWTIDMIAAWDGWSQVEAITVFRYFYSPNDNHGFAQEHMYSGYRED
ncbi:hypothetical protein DFH09DRAFT_1118316 [Mycena vulgaris]|nr:hypothetical protein DFH09DRAFT_1118316 [Mycena vulgaris]